MYKLRAFRAVDDLASCERFAEGHLNVLKDYGVSKVTTAKLDWFHNPGVYVVLVESPDGTKVYGGERIHMTNDFAQLPVEEAVSIVDKGVYGLVERYKTNLRTGELCGLWNAKEAAGRGLSVVLTMVGVALAKRLSFDSLFVLCAPYTVEMCQKAGFQIEESIGNQGTFYYPKLDLIATILMVKDLQNLPGADEAFKEKIFDLVANPLQKREEMGPKGVLELEFDLNIQL